MRLKDGKRTTYCLRIVAIQKMVPCYTKLLIFGLGIQSLKKNLPDTFFVIDKNSSYFEKECIFFLPLNGLETVIPSKL